MNLTCPHCGFVQTDSPAQLEEALCFGLVVPFGWDLTSDGTIVGEDDWADLGELAWDAIIDAGADSTSRVFCPKCSQPSTLAEVKAAFAGWVAP